MTWLSQPFRTQQPVRAELVEARVHVLLAAAMLAMAMSSALAQAQSYPNKAIRVIVPFTPGDTAGVLARLIGPKMSERMGQQVIVENRAGASGQIGIGAFTTFASQVKAGKIRLLGITNSTRVTLNPALPLVAEAVPGYDSRDRVSGAVGGSGSMRPSHHR